MSEQGVNGVIIVTTVKGKEKITVNVNSAIDFKFSFMPKLKTNMDKDGMEFIYLTKTDLGDFLLMAFKTYWFSAS
jgi:hypothetical protein